MGKIILKLIGWTLRKAGLFLLLLGTLMLAPSVVEFGRWIGSFEPGVVASNVAADVAASVPGKDASRGQLKHASERMTQELDDKRKERRHREDERCFLPTCRFLKSAALFRLDLEIELLQVGSNYVGSALSGGQACGTIPSTRSTITLLRSTRQELINAGGPWTRFGSAARALRAQISALEEELSKETKICDIYQALSPRFTANNAALVKKVRGGHEAFLKEVQQFRIEGSEWMRRIGSVFGTALLIFLGILFGPFAVKALAYYGVAPIAARRFSVRLLPAASGEVTTTETSQELLRVTLKAGEELLVDPALLRGSSDAAAKRSQLLLDKKRPFTSIASGQYLLTHVSAIENEASLTLSSDASRDTKLTVIVVPPEAALTLQPRCLAGVVHRVGEPPRITTHWRFSLGSWLTLQLRYVVFHGPVKVIVAGVRGVEIDKANGASSINQAATLGFSANLSYDVARCETFYAYLSGKKELFNDRFSGGTGYYVHEVHPRPDRKTLLPGRGIEGMLNSLLKVFGI